MSGGQQDAVGPLWRGADDDSCDDALQAVVQPLPLDDSAITSTSGDAADAFVGLVDQVQKLADAQHVGAEGAEAEVLRADHKPGCSSNAVDETAAFVKPAVPGVAQAGQDVQFGQLWHDDVSENHCETSDDPVTIERVERHGLEFETAAQALNAGLLRKVMTDQHGVLSLQSVQAASLGAVMKLQERGRAEINRETKLEPTERERRVWALKTTRSEKTRREQGQN